MTECVAEVWVLFAAIAAVALLSSVETALSGVSEPRVRVAKERMLANAQSLSYWVAHPARVLTTLHLVRLLLTVAAGWAAVGLVSAWGYDGSPWLVLAATAVLLLLFGHLLPRNFAKRHSLEWATATIRVMRVMSILLAPLVVPLMSLARAIGARWGAPGEPCASVAFWNPDELERLAEESRAGALPGTGREIYRSIIEFSDTIIREIMVPRTEMLVLPADSSVDEVQRTLIEGGHSRIPVYEDNVDHILGLLYVKDISAVMMNLAAKGMPVQFDLRSMVRPVFYVPEVMKISELLREFQRRKTHLAVVVDEYGGTAGVVTLEDIIEEIVGEIHDEYDVEEKQFRVLADNKVVADGRVSVWDLEQTLGVDFPSDAGFETLAGFLTARAGYLPSPGTVVAWGGLRFTVKEADEKRVRTVEIERRKPDGNRKPAGA